jgi:hypothetical protein
MPTDPNPPHPQPPTDPGAPPFPPKNPPPQPAVTVGARGTVYCASDGRIIGVSNGVCWLNVVGDAVAPGSTDVHPLPLGKQSSPQPAEKPSQPESDDL